jgi:membrane-bound metal-dependent hydrolase YbcI (DUF457 family)
VSWAAHELEDYLAQKHLGTRVSFLAVALGADAPDLLTKGLVSGVRIGPLALGGHDPLHFQRGWPGAGFTHSLLFGAVVAALVLALTRSRPWALGLLVGQWMHVVSDITDTSGSLLFFPFSHEPVSIGAWRYAAFAGAYGDAAAYYSSLGGVWDALWLVAVVVLARRTLRADYFRRVVVAADPRVWAWLHRRFGIEERGLLALYRGLLFYGACRIAAWTIHARFVADAPLDLRWGGPRYVRLVDLSEATAGEVAVELLRGGVLLAAVLALAWLLCVRHLWHRARLPTPPSVR